MAQDVWIFHGSEPVMWRIPVKIIFTTDERFKSKRQITWLEPAVVLMGAQRLALNNFLRSQKGLENEDGKWRFVYPQKRYWTRLENLGATRATSDDPEDHLVWGARRPPMDKMTPDQTARRAWFEDLLARGVGDSVEQLAHYWRAFCIHIAHTLINKEQPVDCYFFKLHNVPLRSDWKEFVTATKPPKEPRFLLVRILASGRMLAFDVEGDHCLRHIELEHTDEWWKLIRKAESERRDRKGREEYANSFQRSLERFALTGWRLYCIHRKEMVQTCAIRVPNGRNGRFRFVPHKVARPMCVETYIFGRNPTPATFKHLRWAIKSSKKYLFTPNGFLSSVPRVRLEKKVVRQPEDERPGPEVDEPGDGGSGGDGVLVCHDRVCVVQEKEVLASRTGDNDDGLAAGA